MASNNTTIPAPRVDFIDPRTGLMSREWYRFFLNLFDLTGAGQQPVSIEEVLILPPPQDIGNIAAEIRNDVEQSEVLSGDPQTAEILKMVDALALYDQASYLLSEVSVLRTQTQDVSLQDQVAALLANQAEMQKQLDALSMQPAPQVDRDKTLVAGANITLTETVDEVEIAVTSPIDIDAGTIDGTVIGGSVPAAGSFTTITSSGNATLGDGDADVARVTGKLRVGSNLTTGSNAWGDGNAKVEGDSFHGFSAVTHNNTDANTSFFQTMRSLGTGASPLAVGSSTFLGSYSWTAYDGVNAAYRTAADIISYVDGAVSSTVVPGSIRIRTANSSGVLTERMRIDSAGATTITGALATTGTLNSGGGAWFGTAALATGATTGHMYIPTSAGAPTGVPATKTGQVAIQFDTTNDKLYVYDGAWLSTPALT